VGSTAAKSRRPKERYDAKQELALHAIYGVDVNDVAVEIAKLRIWLKIIEGNSWNEKFGRLPNIDVNIVAGNSLVGFPVRGDVQTQFGAIDERLPTLAKSGVPTSSRTRARAKR